MPMDYSESKNYSSPKSLLFKEVLDVLNALGFKIKNSNELSGLIEASKGASFRSWGESVRISIVPLDGGSNVNVESGVKYQVADYGKNKENVHKILAELDGRVLSSAYGPQPPPPPSTLAQNCPTCGRPLTFVQQYNRWYCPNCKRYP